MSIKKKISNILNKLPIRDDSIEMFAITDTGLVRQNNEDSYLVSEYISEGESFLPEVVRLSFNRDSIFMMVSDGMGGQVAGEVASNIAANVVRKSFIGLGKGGCDLQPTSESDFVNLMVKALNNADHTIKEATVKDSGLVGMGATATLACFFNNKLYIAQVGDSRAYIIRSGVVTQVTRDQSFVQKLLEEGTISEDEALTHPHRNIILQALGAQTIPLKVSVSSVELCKGDYILLCSDGLSGMLKDSDIARIVNSSESIEALSEELVDLANENGGKDNITVTVAHMLDKNLPASISGEVSVNRLINFFDK